MYTAGISQSVAALFGELTGGTQGRGGFVLNMGDRGLLHGLDTLSATDASRSLNGGATVAAHAQHLRYGVSLMNRWAREGGNPFADAKWDDAWKVSVVNDQEWSEIRQGLRAETEQWRQTLSQPRESAAEMEVRGLISSVAHLAYHLGAIRQIAAATRGPREGTFT